MNRTYKCPKCGVFEHYRKDTEILETCPYCESKVNQKFGGFFKLVGPGFYSTDNGGVK